MKKILITGAVSYIGTSLQKYLSEFDSKYKIQTMDVQKVDRQKHNFTKHDIIFHVAEIAHADVDKVSEEMQKNTMQLIQS